LQKSATIYKLQPYLSVELFLSPDADVVAESGESFFICPISAIFFDGIPCVFLFTSDCEWRRVVDNEKPAAKGPSRRSGESIPFVFQMISSMIFFSDTIHHQAHMGIAA
jgi:hypothetical protein